MIAGTQAEYQQDVGSTNNTSYLTLTEELLGDLCEYFWENELHYKGTVLYIWDMASAHLNQNLYIISTNPTRLAFH